MGVVLSFEEWTMPFLGRLFILSFLLVCVWSCATGSSDPASDVGSSELSQEKSYYTVAFVEKMKTVRQLQESSKPLEAFELLKGIKDQSLNGNEKALKYNFMGVIIFQKGAFKDAVGHFEKAKSFDIEDLSLTSQISLNLASVYFKTNRLEEAGESVKKVELSQLKESERYKYEHLRYLLSPSDFPSSFDHLVNYFKKYKKLEEVKSDLLFNTLVSEFHKNFKDEDKVTFLTKQSGTPSLIEAYLTVLVLEKKFQEGKGAVTAQDDFLVWAKKRFIENSEASKLIKECEERPKQLAEMDPHALGLVLPLSGEKGRFGKRVVFGLDVAMKVFSKGKEQFSTVLIKDSKGNEALGADIVSELAKQKKVALIIGGLFPEEAKEEYLAAKKLGVFFISLSPIYLPKEEKDHLLLEIPGSVESITDTLLTEAFATRFGKKGAILYSDDERGQSFMRAFMGGIQKQSVLSVTRAGTVPMKEKDLRVPMMKFLGLSFERERQEELDMMLHLGQLEGKNSSKNATHVLWPVVDFDWVFLPLFPDVSAQILPLFSYYDVPKTTFIGAPSWRSRSLEVLGKRLPLYFVGEEYGGASLDSFKNEFRLQYKAWPQLMEISAYDAVMVVADLMKKIKADSWGDRFLFKESLKKIERLEGATANWSLKEGRWPKSLNIFRLTEGKVDKIL